MPNAPLPAIAAPDFELTPGETLGSSLRRLSVQQLEFAITGLTDESVSKDWAVHEMRKATKRLRALLRMVRPTIGDKIFNFENQVLRDAAAQTSGARDGAVMVDAVRRLRSRYGHLLAPGVFGDVEARLDRRHHRLLSRVLDDEENVRQLVVVLYRARSRYAAWPVDPHDPRFSSKVIPNGFRAIEAGIASTYARGRREMRLAYSHPTAEHFHEWRKRVKYLRHQMEILSPIWPDVVGGLASSLASLGDALGEEHDQAELVKLVASLPDLIDDPDERTLLVMMSNQRRRELQAAARVMGARAFAEGGDQFSNRLKAYWSAWSLGAD